MPSPQQQTGNNHENSLDFLWLIVMVLAAVVLTWYFGQDHIAKFIYQLRSYEITVINFVLEPWRKLVQFSHLPLPVPNTQNLTNVAALIQTKPKPDVNELISISNTVGRYLCYPVAAILLILSFTVYRSNLAAKFKTILNMQKLKKLEYKDWPEITPVIKLDLVNQDINQGPWAMAQTPMDFCKQHKILKIEKENNETKVSLIPGAAHRIFALQLGAVWNSPERLPIHAQALFAIFAARANRDRDGATKLLRQISASADSGKLDFTGAKELLAKYSQTKLVELVASKHAYVLTVMATMLELGRSDGVIATAEFLWLKPLDRRLWYMLNSVGRQTAVPEIAGAFSHWIAERKLGRPLRVPMVDEAAKGLEAALKDILYEPETE